ERHRARHASRHAGRVGASLCLGAQQALEQTRDDQPADCLRLSLRHLSTLFRSGALAAPDCVIVSRHPKGAWMMTFRSIVLTMTAAALVTAFAEPAAAQRKSLGKKEPVYCTRQYDPVCTRTDKGVLTTFTNACTAKAAGAAVIAKG